MSKRALVKVNGLVALAAVVLFVNPVRGHVLLLYPNGGEQMEVCSQTTIRWQIQISHTLLNWDLWYSKTGAAGPWTELARYTGSGSDPSYLPASHDISAYISSNTRIRFKTSSKMQVQDSVWFDNIQILCGDCNRQKSAAIA